MSEQEIFFRMFILKFLKLHVSEFMVNLFDEPGTMLDIAFNDLFPRDCAEESFEASASDGFMRLIRSEAVDCILYHGSENIINANYTKVKITILED